MSTKSATPGRGTSQVEVTNVSPHGFWLLISDREVFVPFKEFPWFRDASIREITNVELPNPHHLYWPALDVDLAVDSLSHREKYPLVSKAQPNHRVQPTKARPAKRQQRRPSTRLRG